MVKIFEKKLILVKIFEKFRFFRKFRKIPILLKFSENFNLNEIFDKNFDFGQNFRKKLDFSQIFQKNFNFGRIVKISILLKIFENFEKFRFYSTFRKISILVKFS